MHVSASGPYGHSGLSILNSEIGGIVSNLKSSGYNYWGHINTKAGAPIGCIFNGEDFTQLQDDKILIWPILEKYDISPNQVDIIFNASTVKDIKADTQVSVELAQPLPEQPNLTAFA